MGPLIASLQLIVVKDQQKFMGHDGKILNLKMKCNWPYVQLICKCVVACVCLWKLHGVYKTC